MKYETSKASKIEIDNLIAQIQSDCYIVSQDRSDYTKDDQ